MSNTLIVLLSHQQPDQLARTLALWEPIVEKDSLLLAYGGDADTFRQIQFEPKLFVEHSRLRVKDQQRGQQSWAGVFDVAYRFLRKRSQFDYVYVVEYDHIPLVHDLIARMTQRLKTEGADVLAHHLGRIDDSSSPHYLYHSNEKRFHEYFAALSVRANKRIILSMLGTGSFWTRKAFEAVATREEPFPIYVELYPPTLAHHLGFRIRDIPDQNEFVTHLGNRYAEIDVARNKGAWTLHPVKTLPSDTSSLT